MSKFTPEDLLFSERMALDSLFIEYANKHKIAISPMNVIGWLQTNGAINKAGEALAKADGK